MENNTENIENQIQLALNFNSSEIDEDQIEGGSMMITSIEEVEIPHQSDQLTSNMQLIEVTGEQPWVLEYAEPTNVQPQDDETDAILWVHSNIIRLSNKFGVDFKGCEKEAFALFRKIYSRRKNNNPVLQCQRLLQIRDGKVHRNSKVLLSLMSISKAMGTETGGSYNQLLIHEDKYNLMEC